LQHKSLLLFSGKKVIVAKEELCGIAHSGHEKDSLFSSCGHYTTSGGIFQEGGTSFFKFLQNRNVFLYPVYWTKYLIGSYYPEPRLKK